MNKRTIFVVLALCLSAAALVSGQGGFVNGYGQRVDGASRTMVVGSDAVGAAPTANPIVIAGYDGTNLQMLRTATSATLASIAGTQVVSPVAIDPCQSPAIAKSSASIAIASATTTQIVALSGSTIIYVCGYNFSITGTLPTYQFEYGTGSNCGTGTTVLSGAFLPIVGTLAQYSPTFSAFKSAAGNALCIVTTGTLPSLQGVLTYVQQ